MSDRIALINRGRIEQLGNVQEIYHRPATAFVAEFLGSANLLEAELVAREGGGARVRVKGGLELRVKAERWPAGRERARVSIRPEKVHLSRAPLGERDAFAARVVEEVFKGAVDHFEIETTTGTRLTAVATNESALREPICAGDRVWAAVHEEDVMVVAE